MGELVELLCVSVYPSSPPGLLPRPVEEISMADVKTDRRQALDLAIASIDRQFGKGAIMRLGQNGAFDEIAVIPTGAMQLDVALGIGGIPRGRITEIYGPESSGKTTLALHIISEAQRMGGTAAFIDAEHALDPIYAKNLGVNTDELLISQPDTGEQALEIAETLVRSNAVDAIVTDSVAALGPRAEHNVVENSGTWYTYKSERIGQGRENAKRYLKENPKILVEVEAKVRDALGLRPIGGAAPAPAPEKTAK